MNNVYEKIELFNTFELERIKEILIDKINFITNKKIKTIETIHEELNDDKLILKNKKYRILNIKEYEIISNFPSFIKLKNRFSEYFIGEAVVDNVKLDFPEIYFRLVRPYKIFDIGSVHADNWHHSLANLNYPKGKTYKVLVSIISEPNKNGLIFYPNSLNLETSYKLINNTFIINEMIKEEKIMPAIKPGEAFIFNDTVLHQGAINLGNFTRCSIEITFVPKTL